MRKKTIKTTIEGLMLSAVVAMATGCGSQVTDAAGRNAESAVSASETLDIDTDESNADYATVSGATDLAALELSYSSVTDDMINIKDGDYETSWEDEDPLTIMAKGSTTEADGKGVSVEKGVIRITKEGTYVLTGEFNGMIIVDTDDEDAKVRLVLDDFSITSSEGPAILALTADKVTVTIAAGTENNISDSETYSDAYSDYDAAIYSKTDLVLNSDGKDGSLTIKGNRKDAVHSTEDLRITGGTYIVTAADDGFVGKDRLEITDGTFTVTTYAENGDAFKSTNADDEEKGFIYIAGGTFDITSGDEAFQSAAGLLVTSGTFQISAEGKGFHADGTLQFDGGDVTITTSYEGLEAPVIVINDGTFDITATDDGINAAGGALESDEQEDSEIVDNSEDTVPAAPPDQSDQEDNSDHTADANQEDSEDGTEHRDPPKKPEDDWEQESGTGDGPGNRAGGGFGPASSSTGYLFINGGTIHINASGDGIDSNASITQTGGEVTVDGPTANMDGALDYDDTYDMNGGSLFAVGSSGMLQTISESSEVNCLAVIFNDVQDAGSTITIEDADGNQVAEFTPQKSYQSFVFASEALVQEEKYTVTVNGDRLFSVTLDGTVTMVDDNGDATSAGQMGGFGGMGMPSGRPGPGGFDNPGNGPL